MIPQRRVGFRIKKRRLLVRMTAALGGRVSVINVLSKLRLMSLARHESESHHDHYRVGDDCHKGRLDTEVSACQELGLGVENVSEDRITRWLCIRMKDAEDYRVPPRVYHCIIPKTAALDLYQREHDAYECSRSHEKQDAP